MRDDGYCLGESERRKRERGRERRRRQGCGWVGFGKRGSVRSWVEGNVAFRQETHDVLNFAVILGFQGLLLPGLLSVGQIQCTLARSLIYQLMLRAINQPFSSGHWCVRYRKPGAWNEATETVLSSALGDARKGKKGKMGPSEGGEGGGERGGIGEGVVLK